MTALPSSVTVPSERLTLRSRVACRSPFTSPIEVTVPVHVGWPCILSS
jgi:hypothetical protein